MNWGEGFTLLGGGDLAGYIVIALIVIVPLIVWYIKRGLHHAEIKQEVETLKVVNKYEELKKEKPGEAVSILGTGSINCAAFRPGNILDWTTIPFPIGEVYLADTSCPVSGNLCIVRELDNGEVVDYDPREVEVIDKQTPEWAWQSTHCKEMVRRFWCVQLSIWKSPAIWLAAGMIMVTFIFAMGVIGK